MTETVEAVTGVMRVVVDRLVDELVDAAAEAARQQEANKGDYWDLHEAKELIRRLEVQVDDLEATVDQMSDELTQAHQENIQLLGELGAVEEPPPAELVHVAEEVYEDYFTAYGMLS
jgi:hypothetical protein